MKGQIERMGFGMGGELSLTLSLPRQYTEEMKALMGSEISAEIKKWRNRRSLSANAYAWLLISKIAESTRPPMSKEAVYLEMLKRYGQTGIISVEAEKALPVKRELKYWESVGSGRVAGKEFEHIRLWVGSSNYDTSEMAIFIDGVVGECKDLGIETLPPHELERMKGEWEN